MLVFSTKIPLNDNITREDCVRLFIKWVEGSQRNQINGIKYDTSSHKDFFINDDNTDFYITHYHDTSVEISACRLVNYEPNFNWYTDCICVFEGYSKAILIQMNCHSKNPRANLPTPHNPYLIKMLVSEGFCAKDGELNISPKPLLIDDHNIQMCASIMCGTSNNSLPVVYLSNDGWGSIINANGLAKDLLGSAHVLLEESQKISFQLKELTNSKNAHSGCVGIYYPSSQHFILLKKDSFQTAEDFRIAVNYAVKHTKVIEVDPNDYSWSKISSLKSREKIQAEVAKKEAGSKELEEFLISFDSENSDLKSQIEELQREKYLLESKLEEVRYRLQQQEEGNFLNPGKEHELYSGERTDMIISILNQVVQNYEEGSRAVSLIKSILEANPYDGSCDSKVKKIKSIFGNGSGQLTKASKAELKQLGFIIDESGKTHDKIIFFDERYSFTVSKTPSDYLGGKNLCSDIIKIINVTKKF